MWRTRRQAAIPAPEPEDLMDWQPTTPPPQTPEPPIYPQSQYVPGGWPNVLPTPRFARPFELGAYVPSPKRVCLGLAGAGAATAAATANVTLAVGTATATATANATVAVGAAAVKYTARGAVHGANVAAQALGKTTISIVRKFNKEHPRDRATTKNGVAYDRARGYESPRFNRIRIRIRPDLPTLEEEDENKLRAEMEERDRAREYAKAEYEAKFGHYSPWKNNFEKSNFVTVPFIIPNDPKNWTEQIKRSSDHLEEQTEAAANVSPQQTQRVQQLAGSKPATAKPYFPSAKRLRKRRSNKPAYSLVSFKTASRRVVPAPRPAPMPVLTPPSPDTPKPEEHKNAVAGPEFLWAADTPTTPSRSPNTTQTPADAKDDDVYVPPTPSRDNRPRLPVHSLGTWARVQQMFFTPPRPEQPAQPEQEEQQLNAEDTEQVSTTEQQQQQLNAEGTEVTTAEQQEKELDAGSTEAPVIPETVSTPVRETEQPSRPDTPSTSYSDISSTCDITPIPYELKHIAPAGDAVGPSSPSPQAAAESAPPSRDWPSVVGKTPGGWDDETTAGEHNYVESDQPITGPVARRTRSMQLRVKKEEESIRTPQKEAKTELIKKPVAKTEKTAAELAAKTPRTAKTPKHGNTKTKIANDVQERRETLRRAAEKWKITGLSPAWIEKVEAAVTYGDKRSGLKAGDFARVAPFRTHGASRDNWLNDETINEYLTIVAAHGQNTPDANGKKATHKTHHAFNSFFYESLTKNGVKALARWGKRAKIEGKKLLDTKQVYFPINASAHWTLAVVSGASCTITHYDSLGGKGTKKMEAILEWVAMELGDDFVRAEWRLLEGMSGRQNNSDDCGVFAVTNARSLMLDESPEKSFGPDKVRFQRERIVAEIVNGALLPRGE